MARCHDDWKGDGMADLESWWMWRERCALARCVPEVQGDLRGFAQNRYALYLRKLNTGNLQPPSAADAWHGFETHLALGPRRSQKSYKEWLFTRGEGEATLDRIQGGATLLMRDVVRERLRREHSPSWMTSLDAPTGAGADAPSLADLLPSPQDPLTEVERRDFAELATAAGGTAFAALTHRERIAVLASLSGLSLAHPVVVAAAACAKSSLFNALHSGMETLSGVVRESFGGEDASARTEIALLLLHQVRGRTVAWMRLEKSLAPLFLLLEEHQGRGVDMGKGCAGMNREADC
jgi:hypothetical protein